MRNKKGIIFMAATPPPYMGPSVATDIILNSRFVEEFNIFHIDTADRRPLKNLGKIDFINIILSLKHYFQLLKYLIFSGAELVYVPITQTTIGFLRDVPFIILSKLFRKKIVLHLRGGNFRNFYKKSNIVTQFFIRKTLRMIDRMIVLCHSLRKVFKHLVPEDKISFVPNGLNLNLDKSKTKNNEKLTIIFLSNLRKSKGFWETLFSIKKVVQYDSNVIFIFAGSWRYDEDRIKCQCYLKKEKIEDYVIFEDSIVGREKTNALQEAHVFVLPTYNEGHPWVIVEAMAAGLPIITTDSGCIKECVIDGENGFIIPKQDPSAVAEKIIYFMKYCEKRGKMGKRSRELYEQNFTEEHFVQGMINVINLTLN
jgi:glycosyltransferase involved in cell wall biosynthesis